MESAEQGAEMKPKKSLMNKRNLMIAGGVILAVIVLGGGYMLLGKSSDPQVEAKREADAVIKQVERHMVLPTGETPTVATVSDPEKLKDQKFFANAKKGDKVLIYSGAQKAILYDPSADRIIEVAPVNIGGGS